MRTVWVHCYRNGSLLRSYDFGVPETLNDTAVKQPTAQELEDQARDNLTTERLAKPPYAGFTFEIEYPRS
jgi:hypothetical protein